MLTPSYQAELWGSALCAQTMEGVTQDKRGGFLTASSVTFMTDHGGLPTPPFS